MAVQGPFRRRPLDGGYALLSEPAAWPTPRCNDALSEAANTDIMGPGLSAALALRPKHLDRAGYFVAGGCAVVAGCSMIVAWVQTRSSIGAASSGSSPWKVANWQSTPQRIGFAVVSTGGSSWAIAVTFETRAASIPSAINPSARCTQRCR